MIDFKNLQEFRNSDTVNYSVNDIELDDIKFTSINSRYNYPNNLKLPYYYNSHFSLMELNGIINPLDKWRSSTETKS